jgi:hypothetical protein
MIHQKRSKALMNVDLILEAVAGHALGLQSTTQGMSTGCWFAEASGLCKGVKWEGGGGGQGLGLVLPRWQTGLLGILLDAYIALHLCLS